MSSMQLGLIVWIIHQSNVSIYYSRSFVTHSRLAKQTTGLPSSSPLSAVEYLVSARSLWLSALLTLSSVSTIPSLPQFSPTFASSSLTGLPTPASHTTSNRKYNLVAVPHIPTNRSILGMQKRKQGQLKVSLTHVFLTPKFYCCQQE